MYLEHPDGFTVEIKDETASVTFVSNGMTFSVEAIPSSGLVAVKLDDTSIVEVDVTTGEVTQ